MESGFISDPTNLAGWEFIGAPPPVEMPLQYPTILMGSARRSPSMGRQYILQATNTIRR
jgi:hypothetical protein